MKRKWMAVGLILLFVGTCLIPATAQNNVKQSPTSRGEWLYVGGSGTGNYSSIQRAIDNANDGDTVFVYSGTYYEYINVNKSINLIGENNIKTIINGGGGVNHKPVNANPSPRNGATDVELPPSNFSIYVNDADGDTMNVTFWTNESGTWTISQTNVSVVNGTYYLINKSWIDNVSTIYWWRVTTSDGENGFDNDTYRFITIGRPKFRLWVLTDIHVKVSHYYAFYDALRDSNKAFLWNASIAIGDLIHNDPVDSTYAEYNTWQEVRNESVHGVQDFYPIYGNHEMYHNASGWTNWTKQMDPMGDHLIGNNTNENRTYDMINRLDESHPLSNSTDSRYYFAVGNLLFVAFGPFPGVANHTVWFEWFKSIIENNTEMNIIVYTHFPLPSSGVYQGCGYQWEDSETYESWLNSTATTINLWLNGHTHGLGEVIYNSTTTYNNWNITFIDPGNIFDSRSSLLNFTDGSSLVVLGRYDHKTNAWNFSTTVNLTYPFDIDYVYFPPINSSEIKELNTPLNNKILNTTLENACSRTSLQRDQFGIRVGRDMPVISNSLISGFTLSGNDRDESIGIYSYLQSNNITIENCIIHNFGIGMLFGNGSKDLVIRNCTTYHNSRHGGISFVGQDVRDFEISRCTSYRNTYGIYITDATNGFIYHNNLFDNDLNAYDSGHNVWDAGYPSGGNYWDDYTGIDDDFRDGIGDSPYTISGGSNQDRYPFMEPNGWRKEFHKAFIFGKITNSSVEGYITFEAVKTKVITFKPFGFHLYESGEVCVIVKDSLCLLGERYVVALCAIIIEI